MTGRATRVRPMKKLDSTTHAIHEAAHRVSDDGPGTLAAGLLAGALLASLLLMGVAAPAVAQTLPRVLYVTQSAGFAHPVVPLSEQVLPAIGRGHDAFEVDVTRDASILTADVLARYDAVVFYTTGELPLDAGPEAWRSSTSSAAAAASSACTARRIPSTSGRRTASSSAATSTTTRGGRKWRSGSRTSTIPRRGTWAPASASATRSTSSRTGNVRGSTCC